MTHKFTIRIGDWSHDGHGHTDDFTIEANKRPFSGIYFVKKVGYYGNQMHIL